MNINFDVNPKFEWRVFQGDNFLVEVVAWKNVIKSEELSNLMSDSWVWNVYAYIRKEHSIFNNVDDVLSLPFHGGVSFKQKFTSIPFDGIKYDWQKEIEYAQIGSDYNHYNDEYFKNYDPVDGIPYEIKEDVTELVEALLNYKETNE